jgi:hypothetical protein
MIEIVKEKIIFRLKQIWFAEHPFDVGDADRVIFRDCKNKIDIPGFICEKITTLVIDLTHDLDFIWKNMSEGNVRKPVRRAERAGIKIKMNQNYEDFYSLYKSVIVAKKLSGLININDIKKYGTLFVAEFEGEIISGHGYLEDEKNMRSWVIGSDHFCTNKNRATMAANASKLIIWEAIKYAKAKEIKEFDFGGYAEESDDKQKKSISEFKKSFGGKLASRYVYQKDYSKIYKILSALKQKFVK